MQEAEIDAPAARIVGRADELATLESALRAVRRGRAGWVQIEGEPGIGKTTLLRELCDAAERQGCLVLRGCGTEFEADVPYGLLMEALGNHAAALGAERIRRLSGDRLDELALLLPGLRTDGRNSPALGDERHRLHYAVRALLGGLADPQPVVLALDDVHWADAASIELIGYLARRLPLGGVLLALACRPSQAPARLTRILHAAAGERSFVRVALGPLSRAAARDLVGDDVPAARHADLYAESGGNPLFLTALARTAGDHARAWERSSVPDVPPAVLGALAEELDALSPPALTVARGAAIAGDPFTPALAAATAAVAGDGLSEVDELVSSGLVVVADSPSDFRFRHPVVRRAVYATAGAGWRLGAHGRAAVALGRERARPALRAHHVALSARRGDDTAIALLTEAAAEAAPRAPETAAAWSAAALRLLPADAAQERRLELLLARATSLSAAGRFEECRAELYQVLRLSPASQPALRADVVAFVARIEQQLGRDAEAHTLLTQTLALQPDQRSPAATALRIELAYERGFAADWAGMRRHANDALTALRQCDGAPLRTAAAVAGALAEYHAGSVSDALLLLDEATACLDALADEELAGRLEAATWAGLCEVYVERFDAAQRRSARGLAVARSAGRAGVVVPLTLVDGWACASRGELPRAAELADEAVDASRLVANDQMLVFALQLRCWVAALAGDPVHAVELGEEAVGTAAKLTTSMCRARAGCYLAEAHLEAGDADACRTGLLRAAGGPDLPLVELAFRPRCYEILTRAELAVGEPARADMWATCAAVAADQLGLPGRTSTALRARAAVGLAHGDAVDAAQLALAAARTARAAGLSLDAGRALTLAGAALAAHGERTAACIELEHAEAILSGCDARRFRDDAARQLRRLGQRVPRQGRRQRRPATGIGALTDRERELAELVCEGHGNQAIAAQLHLSTKTVETHLANIFAKLEVRSRAAVAAAIAGTAPSRPNARVRVTSRKIAAPKAR